MKIRKTTTIENIKEPTWDIIKDQLAEGLEKIAIDRRAAIELGVPVEEIDSYISTIGDTTFRRLEKMSAPEMHAYLLGKIIGEIDDPEELREFLEEMEGDED